MTGNLGKGGIENVGGLLRGMTLEQGGKTEVTKEFLRIVLGFVDTVGEELDHHLPFEL